MKSLIKIYKLYRLYRRGWKLIIENKQCCIIKDNHTFFGSVSEIYKKADEQDYFKISIAEANFLFGNGKVQDVFDAWDRRINDKQK